LKQIQPILSALSQPASHALTDATMDEQLDLAEESDIEQRDLVIPTDMHGERLDRALA
jgi:hypothetical protein